MPGLATLIANVINSLVPGLDQVRSEVNAAIGNNHWRVYRVVRTWSGARDGEGTASDVATEITPTPRVGWADSDGQIHFELPPAGVWEDGVIVLGEVSLTYTEPELTGQTSTARVEIYYRLDDQQGQGMAARWFVLSSPPVPHREKSIGWLLYLKRAQVAV